MSAGYGLGTHATFHRVGPDGLPGLAIREAIAEAVHRVVAEALGGDHTRACAWYAWVGAQVARALTGARYEPVAGSLLVQVAPDGFVSFRSELGQFHAWIMLREQARCEIADLAARHFPAYAKAAGTNWEMPAPPAYLWTALPLGVPLDPAPGMFPGFAGIVAYKPSPALTREFRVYWDDDRIRRREVHNLAALAIRHARTLLPAMSERGSAASARTGAAGTSGNAAWVPISPPQRSRTA